MPWQLTLVNREVRLIDPRWTYSLCESFIDSRPDSSRDLTQRINNLQGLISWPHSADISSQRRARAPCCSVELGLVESADIAGCLSAASHLPDSPQFTKTGRAVPDRHRERRRHDR